MDLHKLRLNCLTLEEAKTMADEIENSNEVSLAIMARDRLWCRAACEALDTFVIERLMCRFNELRVDPSRFDTQPEGGKT